MKHPIQRGLTIAVLAGLLATTAPKAEAQRARSVERGRDVGDGQVLYDIPYDPKQVDELTFVQPSAEHPFFEVVAPLGDWNEGSSATVKQVRFNGLVCEAYSLFVDGFSHVQSAWITQKSTTAPNVVLVARVLWHNNEPVTLEVDIGAVDEAGAAKTVTRSITGTAPASGGGPEGWRRYQSFALSETAGIDRYMEPVEFTIAARAENCGHLERELRVFQYDTTRYNLLPINFQTFDARSFPGRPAGTSNENYLQHPSEAVAVACLASVPANTTQVYLVTYDNPDAGAFVPEATDLSVEGESLGARVDNRFYAAKLDDKAGQIVSFQLKGREDDPVPLLTNSLSRAAHWNPDSFSDNGFWGHTFAWDPPENTVVTTRGPILFRITNSGRMPEYTPQVRATVSYSFYAHTPYVKVTTITEVRDPLNASAIRNGELVLDSHLITHFVWQNKDGGVRTIRTAHGPNWQDEWGTRVDQDVPWIAMTNEEKDYGLGEIVLASTAFNPLRGEATQHRPAFYLYYHHFWSTPLTYFTRGWVYPFSDYQRGPIIPVDAGSTYVEKMAFMPFYLHKGHRRYEEIVSARKQLEQPLVQRWGR